MEELDVTLQSTSLYADVLFWSPGFGDEVFSSETLELTFPDRESIQFNSLHIIVKAVATPWNRISIGFNNKFNRPSNRSRQEVILDNQRFLFQENAPLLDQH